MIFLKPVPVWPMSRDMTGFRSLLRRVVLLSAAMLVATPAAAHAAPAESTITGVLQRAVVDTFVSGPDTTVTKVTTGPGSSIGVPADLVRGITTGAGITVTRRADGTATRVVARSSVASTAPVTGIHHLVFVPMYWRSDTGPATLPSAAELTAVAASVDSFYDTVSAGMIRFTVDQVYPARKVTATSCNDTNGIEAAARTVAAVAPGDLYHHVVAYFPLDSGCKWAGLGSVSGNFIWLNGYNTIHVLGHELGHNLGLSHSDGYHCWSDADRQNPVPLSGNCAVKGYDDPWDQMGNGTGELSAANLDLLGVLGAGGTQQATAGRPVVLAPLSGGKGLRQITYPVGTRTYYLEYRDGGRLDHPFSQWGTGLAVRFTDTSPADGYARDHQLVSYHPGAPVLRPGEGWNDPAGTISIRTAAVTAAGLTVTVGSVSDTQSPSPFSLTAPAKSASLSTAKTRVTWTPVTDNTEVVTVSVMVGDTVVATVPGTATAAAVTIPDGAHALRAVATDPYGNTSTTSAVTVTVDGNAPIGTPPPTASLMIGGTVSATSVPVVVKWGLTDPNGVSRQKIEQSTASTYTTLGATVRQITAVTKPGARSRWQLAVTDKLGHSGTVAGDWTTTTLDTRGGIFTGAWATVTNKTLLGGSEQTTVATDAAVSYTFTGRTVGLIGTRDATSGLADVYADGRKLNPINLSAWANWSRSLVYTLAWPASGTHTVKFVNHASRLNIDAFAVLS